MLKLIAPLLALAALSAPAQAQDAAAGKRAFLKCAACHSIKPGDPNKIGPNLSGVVGRKAGSATGFRYSAAMKAKGAGITWDAATLDKWLTRPSAVIPGTSMAFGGIPNPAERAALIAYLKKPQP
ncbi:c-type cytochrome [Rhizorhabdus phycosphaerae]|uniref:c-type cytochrome n=1 Tax=Rhizorhabdus phycosphaerae TaxID=2711156 RepID=UPI001D00D301|nr:cytochrome c family protein [Rhizorhabdus phycosphaerae]